jgi:hypothetical protein
LAQGRFFTKAARAPKGLKGYEGTLPIDAFGKTPCEPLGHLTVRGVGPSGVVPVEGLAGLALRWFAGGLAPIATGFVAEGFVLAPRGRYL